MWPPPPDRPDPHSSGVSSPTDPDRRLRPVGPVESTATPSLGALDALFPASQRSNTLPLEPGAVIAAINGLTNIASPTDQLLRFNSLTRQAAGLTGDAQSRALGELALQAPQLHERNRLAALRRVSDVIVDLYPPQQQAWVAHVAQGIKYRPDERQYPTFVEFAKHIRQLPPDHQLPWLDVLDRQIELLPDTHRPGASRRMIGLIAGLDMEQGARWAASARNYGKYLYR